MDWNSLLAGLPFNGAKTYVAAIGLVGLGVYQISQSQLATGVQTILAGLAALGLRHALEKGTPPAG